MGLHLHPTYVLANRAEIEAEVERLIALLDMADGDCDLEDDDPAGDPLDIEGEAPSDVGTAVMATRPIYGVDQSHGPTNEAAAYRAHKAAQLGLVRTATGWRWP
ncbi:hypothetical protein [Sphingomonas sp.]|uniref:hypothetical protein n=1 Tax=Sphingomonas sp. TaxID=28214 RepID=UPI003AFFAE04